MNNEQHAKSILPLKRSSKNYVIVIIKLTNHDSLRSNFSLPTIQTLLPSNFNWQIFKTQLRSNFSFQIGLYFLTY